MPSAVSLDTVMIKIESEAGKAGANIDSLANKLQNLRNSVKGGFNNLDKLSESLEKLTLGARGLDATVNNLKNLSNITDGLIQLSEVKSSRGLTTIVTQLNNLNKASKNLDKTSSNLSTIGSMIPNLGSLSTIKAPTGLTSVVKNLTGLAQIKGIDSVISEIQKVPQLVEPLSKLGDIVNPKGFQTAVDNLGKLPDVINKFDTTTFENIKRVSEELAQSLTPLADKMMQVANGYSAFSKIQNTFGKSASTSYRYMKQQHSILSSLSGIVKKAGSYFVKTGRNIASAFGSGAINNLKKFHSKFKQIFLSLLGTRTLFTMIRKAASEYQAFDISLQKFSQNVWRAFGAQLAPIIEYAMNLFKQFVRVIYSVVYALTGIDLIARANEKAMQSWGDSAKDTLGNLQKFDDLNVVEFQTSAGNGNNNELIEMDKIDLTPFQKIIDWVKQLRDEIKKALDTGEWYNVGKVFAEGINEGVSWLLSKIPEIREKLLEAARDFGDFLNGIIENTNWGDIATLITESLILIPDMITELLKTIKWDEVGKGIDDFLKKLDPVKIIHSFMSMLGELALGLSEAFLNIDWGSVAKKISDSIIAFFTDLTSILDKIPWKDIGKKVREAIENIDWKGIWDSIVKAAEESFDSLNEFLSGLTGLDPQVFEDLEKAIVGIGVALTVYKIVKAFKSLSIIFSGAGFLTAATTFTAILGVLAGLDLAIKGIKEMLESPSWKAFFDILAGIAIVVAAVAIALGGWVVALVAGVVALVSMIAAYIAENWEEVQKWWDDVVSTVSGWFSDMGKAISDWWNDLLKGISDFFDNIGKGISDWWSGIQTWWDNVKKWWSQKFDDFSKLIDEKFVKPIKDFINDIKKNIKEKVEDIKQIIKDVKDWITKKIDDIKKTLSKIGDWLYNHTIKPIQDKFDGLKKKLSSIFDDIKNKWNSFWEDGLLAGCKKIINKILEAFEKFINGIVKGINGLSKGLRQIGNKVFDIIGVDVKFNPISEINIPKLATGTNEIEYEGLYHLHPGEAVVPKKYNPALGNGGSEEMNNKLDTLIDIMNNMSFTNVVNVGNKKLYEEQQSFNKKQQNKYGTINLY